MFAMSWSAMPLGGTPRTMSRRYRTSRSRDCVRIGSRLLTVPGETHAGATPSRSSEVPGQAQSPELGALPLGLERLAEVGLAEEEGETAMSHGDAECGHADEGLGAN